MRFINFIYSPACQAYQQDACAKKIDFSHKRFLWSALTERMGDTEIYARTGDRHTSYTNALQWNFHIGLDSDFCFSTDRKFITGTNLNNGKNIIHCSIIRWSSP